MSFHICHYTDENGITDYNIFLFFFLSPLSSAYSFLFSLTSVLSHRFPFTDSLSLINCWSVIANPSSPISHRLYFASSLLISPSIVIVIVDRNRRGHRHWGEIEIDVKVRSECSSWLWASTLRSWLWALTLRWGEILIMGCRCKWIRGFGLAVLVVSRVWVAVLMGFCCVFWVWVAVLMGVALFLMSFVVGCWWRWLWWWFCFQFFVLQWIVAVTVVVVGWWQHCCGCYLMG